MAEVLEVTTTFALPEWFPPERLDYTRYARYGKGHAWEGQVEKEHYENSAVEALHRLKDVKETCTHPFGKWVTFELDTTKPIQPQIDALGAKLDRFLNRYKEARNVSNCQPA